MWFGGLLDMETVNYEGTVVKARDLRLDLGYGVPPSPKKVPVYIGATGPQNDGIIRRNCRRSFPQLLHVSQLSTRVVAKG